MAAPRKPRKPVNADYLKKAPSETHVAFSEYIASTTGTEVPAETVGLVQRLYPLYLKSPAVASAREAEKKAREEEAARKAEAKAAKARERLARLDAQRAKVLAELGIEDEGVVVDASERFTDTKGIDFTQPEPEVEEDEETVEEDGEPQAAEVTVEDGDDDDLWDDEDEDEEDF